MTIAIIADDLTGANDSGLQFASYGLPTTVFLGTPSDDLLKSSTVAVIDTETRALEAPQVQSLIAAVTSRIRDAGTRHVYKKVDSTMRGHVGLELDTAARSLDVDFIFFSPAFPAMGRTVEDGVLLVDGIPVDRTPIARDPGSPVRDANLMRLLAPHMATIQFLSVSVADLQDPAATTARLRDLAGADGQRVCAIFDARTDEDLAAIAKFGTTLCASLGSTVLWSGSAGLATQLPAAWGVVVPTATTFTLPAATRPPMLVLGSVNPVSIAQLQTLADQIKTSPVVLSPDHLLGTQADREAEIARGIAAMRECILHGDGSLILTTAHSDADVDRIVALAQSKGLTRGEAGRLIAEGLAAVTIALLNEEIVNRLVTTGGDTSRAIMDAAGIHAMTVEGAVEPGVPLVTTRNGPRWHIVTKAGGFGTLDTLINSMSFLSHGRLAS